MCHWYYKLDMTSTLTTHFLLCNLYATTVADNSLITDTLILSTSTLIVLRRTKDSLAEQTIALWLVSTIVDGLWFGDLSEAVLKDLFGRSKSDGNFGKITLNF